jgi:phosphate:Na+ symporter
MSLELAIPIILGANIGTCVPALVAGYAGDYNGKRLAYAHLTFKVLGALPMLFIIPEFAYLCREASNFIFWQNTSITRQVANAHTFFNIGISILFLPFISYGAKVLEKAIPTPKESILKDRFRTQFLDPNSLDTPALAQAGVTREIHRAAGIVHGMFHEIIPLFENPKDDLFEQIEEEDDRVDHLDREIRFYLAKISRRTLTDYQAARQFHLLEITSSLEYIGDTINRDLIKLAKKMRKKGVSFSKKGWEEIKDFHGKVEENFNLALSAFADRHEDLARKVLRHERTLGELEANLRQNHLARLQEGLKESFDTSSIHLELLSELRRINTLLTHLAYAVIDQP